MNPRPNIKLGNFDAVDEDDDLGALRRPRAGTTPPSAPADAATSEPDPPVQPSPAKPTPQPAKKAPRKSSTARQTQSAIRPSNVHVPISLLEALAAKKEELGLSNGEVIVTAIESTYADGTLQANIRPAAATGGGLFSARRSKAARTVTGPLTSLNIRLPQDDYGVIDQLVDELGATSRGHLVTEALSIFLATD